MVKRRPCIRRCWPATFGTDCQNGGGGNCGGGRNRGRDGRPSDTPTGTVTCMGGGMSGGGMSIGAGGRLREHNGHGNPLPGAALGCASSFCTSFCTSFCPSAFTVAGSDPAACSAGTGGAPGSAAAPPLPKSSALRLTAPPTVAPATMSLKFKITPTVDCAHHRCGRGECRCDQSDFGSRSRYK